VLVLDEPGVFFHPSLRQKLNGLLFGCAPGKFIGTTLMVTHSESFLSSLTLPYVRCVYADAKSMQATKLTGKPSLVYDKESLRANFDRFACDPHFAPMYFTPKNQLVFIVEGDFDERFLSTLFSVFAIDATFIACGGKENIIFAANLAEFCRLQWRALYDYDAFKVKKQKTPVVWATWEESQTLKGQNTLRQLITNMGGEWVGEKPGITEDKAYKHVLESKVGKFGRVYVWPTEGDLEKATGKPKSYWRKMPYGDLVDAVQACTTTTVLPSPTTTVNSSSSTTSSSTASSLVTPPVRAFVEWINQTKENN